MSAGELKPRLTQPLSGIISLLTFLAIGWGLWYVFSDPRGPIHTFPYPFAVYMAMMILVGVWQHIILGDWPVQNVPQPAKGVILTIVNLILVWFVIHIVFYRILGLGFNFLSQSNLEALAAGGSHIAQLQDSAGTIINCGKELSLDKLIAGTGRYPERAIVCFVLIGFFTYPFATILFGKWPVQPSDLKQPMAGILEFCWTSMWTLFAFVTLIVPFWGWLYESVFGTAYGMNIPWWTDFAGTLHVHWVFGWWQWMIILLFMTANVWRMKPWSVLPVQQPLKGLISVFVIFILACILSFACVQVAPLWLPDMTEALGKDRLTRFLWYHAAEISSFTIIPFLIWHHYFDDMVPMKNLDSWASFFFRTVGVCAFGFLYYIFYYYVNFGHWGLGNHHMEHGIAERMLHGEALIWNFWSIIPLLWNEWFFHKWPFYAHDH